MNEHSPKFERVKRYYDAGLWNAAMVRNATKNPKASPWITEAEAEEILSGGANGVTFR